MKEQERYRQPSLPLDGAQRSPGGLEQRQSTPLAGTEHHGEGPVTPSLAADPEGLTHGLASHRLPDELWQEYRFECENRARLDLPDVSLIEFEDMRDWSDGLIEPENVAWPPVPDRPSYKRP